MKEHPANSCYQCHRPLPPHYRELPWNLPDGPKFDTQRCHDTALKRHYVEPVLTEVEDHPDDGIYAQQYKDIGREQNKRLGQQAAVAALIALSAEYQRAVFAFESEQRAEEDALLRQDADFAALISPRPIPDAIRPEHTFILGPAGSGKTTLLEKIIIDDLRKPDPPAMVVIDPKGFMIERLSQLAVFQDRLRDRLIIVDPTTNPAPALNFFDPVSQWNKMWSDQVQTQIRNQIIGTFGYIFSAGDFELTKKQKIDFSYVVRLLYQIPNATIKDLLDILDDPAKRFEDFAYKQYVGRLDDISQRFFRNEFFTEFKESKGQIKARAYMLLQNPSIYACLLPPKRNIDMIQCLAEKKIVFINTGMNVLDKDHAVFGRYFIAATLNAAYARFAIPKHQWHFTSLVIDEFQEFADDEKTPELLRLAREYKLGVTMATQNFHGDPFDDKLRNTISTNTSIKYASSPEGVDIAYMARDLRCDHDFLRQQTSSRTHGKFACFVRGLVQHPMAIEFPFGAIEQEPQMTGAAHAALLAENVVRLAETHKAPDVEALNVTTSTLAGEHIVPQPQPGKFRSVLKRFSRPQPPPPTENEPPEKW